MNFGEKLLNKYKKSYIDGKFYFGNGIIVNEKEMIVGRWDNRFIMDGHKEFEYLLPDDFNCLETFIEYTKEFLKKYNN